jgi:hypothetical protein
MLRREIRAPARGPVVARRPGAARPDDRIARLLELQRGAGNHAVARMLGKRVLARELKKEQIEDLLKEYEGWGLHFEDPTKKTSVELHEANYGTLFKQLVAHKMPSGLAEIKQLAEEIGKAAKRPLLVTQIPFTDQLVSAIDPGFLEYLSELLAHEDNAWMLDAWPPDNPKNRAELLRQLNVKAESLRQQNTIVAWREGLLGEADPFSLPKIFIPSKDSGAVKSKHDKECGDLSLMRFLGLKDKIEAAKMFGKTTSGETENLDILRVLSDRGKPLVVGKPTPWDKAEARLAGDGPWYVMVFYAEPKSPEAIGHAIVMQVVGPKAAPGKGEFAWQSGSRRYVIFDPQGDLDKKKPLDKTRWILAWGA